MAFFPEIEAKQYTNGNINKLDQEDRSFHDWYRFVLSFPPHLVRNYLSKFALSAGDILLDPFCGTGTTLLEAKLKGIHGIGIEANPMACFASKVKTDFQVDSNALLKDCMIIADKAVQFMDNSLIALFAFDKSDQNAGISSEKHYRLVNPEELSEEELRQYRIRPESK
jgi:hypothetical protein